MCCISCPYTLQVKPCTCNDTNALSPHAWREKKSWPSILLIYSRQKRHNLDHYNSFYIDLRHSNSFYGWRNALCSRGPLRLILVELSPQHSVTLPLSWKSPAWLFSITCKPHQNIWDYLNSWSQNGYKQLFNSHDDSDVSFQINLNEFNLVEWIINKVNRLTVYANTPAQNMPAHGHIITCLHIVQVVWEAEKM